MFLGSIVGIDWVYSRPSPSKESTRNPRLPSSATSVSLLHRIRDNDRDEAAWGEFVDRYGSRIFQWCLRRKLQHSDAEDVTQDVLLRIAKKFGEFDYDPKQSFRGWLRRVTENAVIDFTRKRKNHTLQNGSGVMSMLTQAPARAELTELLNEAFDLELLEMAKSRVRNRVLPHRWETWEMMAEGSLSGQEAADKLEISVGTAYATKNQIQNMISEEVARLENGSKE